MKIFPQLTLGVLFLSCLWAQTASSGAETLTENNLQQCSQACAERDIKSALQVWQRVKPQLVASQRFTEAADLAYKLLFLADPAGLTEETITLCGELTQFMKLGQAIDSQPALLSTLIHGIAVKNLIGAGRITQAKNEQRAAWDALSESIRESTGVSWSRGQPIPAQISKRALNLIFRNYSYDAQLMAYVGDRVPALVLLRSQYQEIQNLGDEVRGCDYANQVLSSLASELHFLGHWRECKTVLHVLMNEPQIADYSRSTARFNTAYWTSIIEGPDLALLEEARPIAFTGDEMKAGRRTQKRLLAKMAYNYKQEDFDVGAFARLIEESLHEGDKLEAITARANLGAILNDKRDFVSSEKALITTLRELREIGRKAGEPSVYREYGCLLRDTGRLPDSLRILREAVRLTKSYGWTQHLPTLLGELAATQAMSGDNEGLQATLAELEHLMASGLLEPERQVFACEGIAYCQKSLGRDGKAQTTLTQGIITGRAAGLNPYQLRRIEKFALSEVKDISSVAVPADIVSIDQDRDGYPELFPTLEAPAELTILVYPTGAAPASEITLNLELLEAGSWQVAAKNTLAVGVK